MSERPDLEARLLAAFRRLGLLRQRQAVEAMEAEAARADEVAAAMREMFDLHRSMETGEEEP